MKLVLLPSITIATAASLVHLYQIQKRTLKISQNWHLNIQALGFHDT